MVEPETDAARFWAFALRVYMPDENRALFLRVQDEAGADVPMVLFCLWCGVEELRLSPDAVGAAVAFSAAWRAERVEPVRALRRAWKGAPGALPADLSERARQKVATAEQTLERLQMEHLVTLRAGERGAGRVVRRNLDLYAEVADLDLSTAVIEALDGL